MACVNKIFNGREKDVDKILLNNKYVSEMEYNQDIRSAFLFFTVTGYVWSLSIYILIAFNIVHQKIFEKIPWIFIVITFNFFLYI